MGFVELLQVIDLRSDTVTKPSKQTRRRCWPRRSGDDVYAEDPTVHELEQRVARLLGQQAGLLCVNGSMCNMLGTAAGRAGPGSDLRCTSPYRSCRDGGSRRGPRNQHAHLPLHSRGRLQLEEVTKIVAPSAGPYLVSTAAVAVENTHNFGGGTIQPFDELTALGRLCREHGIGYHLDGARLWNAHHHDGARGLRSSL